MSDGLLAQPIPLVVLLALVGLLPFVFMSVTAFVKISTVLHITKSALGAQSVPSTTVVMALSAALTVLAMSPVVAQIAARAEPLMSQEQPTAALVSGLVTAVQEPLRGFLEHNAHSEERERFLLLAKQTAPDEQKVGASEFRVLVPAFMVSELAEAFMLGFAIFLPFLVVDIVIGNVLLALGMQMMSPTQVSLPFKLLLFIAADGWGLLSESLVRGYL